MDPYYIISIHSFQFRSKLACFDFDHTLVQPKANRIVPKDLKDWKWCNPSVPDTLNTLYNNDYCILIFTNQSKEFKCKYILNILTKLNLPILICIAYSKQYYKPSPFLYDTAVPADLHINITDSFYTGDLPCDVAFAEAIGLRFVEPDDVLIDKSEFKWTTSSTKEYKRQQASISKHSFIAKKELVSSKGTVVYLTKVFENRESFIKYYEVKLQESSLVSYYEVLYPTNSVIEFYDIDIRQSADSPSSVLDRVLNILIQFNEHIGRSSTFSLRNIRVLDASCAYASCPNNSTVSMHILDLNHIHESVESLLSIYQQLKEYDVSNMFDLTVVGNNRLLRLPYSIKAMETSTCRILKPAQYHKYSREDHDIRSYFVTGF